VGRRRCGERGFNGGFEGAARGFRGHMVAKVECRKN